MQKPIAITGQSNAWLLEPFLKSLYPIIGYSKTSQAIKEWDIDGPMWKDLSANLSGRSATAFVWWQGEGDCSTFETNPDFYFYNKLDDVMRRVWNIIGHVPTYVVNLGPYCTGFKTKTELINWSNSNANLLTYDASYYQADGIHMTDDGYRSVAADIVSKVKRNQ